MDSSGAFLNIAHYRVLERVGVGGMGEVYLAQNTKLDRQAALKILQTDLAAHRNLMDRFVREVKAG
jgi:serine/threonine-protein kinase